jgi:hypothetical protein
MLVGDVIAPGNLNNDGNSLTFGFASLFGSWPNSSDTDLATIVFDVAEGASGTTSLDIVETSKAAGFTFDGQSQDVIFPATDSGDSGDSGESTDPVDPVTISVPVQAASTQHVYVSSGTLSEDGTQLTVTLGYLSDDPTTTGVGFTVDFDSSVLTLNDVTMLVGDVIAPGNLNNDGNSLTFGFASLFGSWPNSSDTDLATIVFDVAEGASGTTSLDIVETSKAAGFTFDGQSQEIVIP